MPKKVFVNGLYPVDFPDDYTEEDINRTLQNRSFRPNDTMGNIAMNVGHMLGINSSKPKATPSTLYAAQPGDYTWLNQHQIDSFNKNYQDDVQFRAEEDRRRQENEQRQAQQEAQRAAQAGLQEDKQLHEGQKMDRQRQEKMIDAEIGKVVNSGGGEQRLNRYDSETGGMRSDQIVPPRPEFHNMGSGVAQIWDPMDPAGQTYQMAPDRDGIPITKYGRMDPDTGQPIPGTAAPEGAGGEDGVSTGKKRAYDQAIKMKEAGYEENYIREVTGVDPPKLMGERQRRQGIKDEEARLARDFNEANQMLKSMAPKEGMGFETDEDEQAYKAQKALVQELAQTEVTEGDDGQPRRVNKSTTTMKEVPREEAPPPKDDRNLWQKYAPAALGGKPEPTATAATPPPAPVVPPTTAAAPPPAGKRTVIDGVEVMDHGDGTITLPNGRRARKVGNDWQLVN